MQVQRRPRGGSLSFRPEQQLNIDFEARTEKKLAQGVHHKLTTEDFEVMALIGDGLMGRVYQVRLLRNNKIYAMKTIPKKNGKFSPSDPSD